MPFPLHALLAEACARLPPGRLHVGCSGGLDSTVLLHLLAALPAARAAGLRAIHVHHGLHPQADHWAEHCRQVCAGLDVPLVLRRVRVRPSGEGLEAAARAARHAAFAEVVDDGILAIAHHRGDQAETFLMRALRASGPDGLAAMRAWRRLGRGWLWRPLLDVPRDVLLAYARGHGLRWVEDASNLDTRLDRNFLRQHVLPLLRERWPHAEAAFARAASLQEETAALLSAQDDEALAMARTADPQVLSVAALCALPQPRRARVLRRWLAGVGLPPLPARGVARIESDLLQADADARPEFAWGRAGQDAVVRRWRDLLHAGPRQTRLPAGWCMPWRLEAPLVLPGGDRLELLGSPCGSAGEEDHAADASDKAAPASASALRLPCRVHGRRGGERIVLPGRTHSHALKQVLQELGVPPWERERLPLLSDADGMLLAAGDLVCSAAFDAWLRARGARLHWTRCAGTATAGPRPA